MTLLFAALLFGTCSYVHRERDAVPDGLNYLQGLIEIGAVSMVGLITLFVTRTMLPLRAIYKGSLLCWFGFILAASFASVNSWSATHSLAKAAIACGALLAALFLARAYGPLQAAFSLHKATVFVVVTALVVSLIAPGRFPLLSHIDADPRERLLIFCNSPVYSAYLIGLAFIIGLSISLSQWTLLHVLRQVVLLGAILLTETRWAIICLMVVSAWCLISGNAATRFFRGVVLGCFVVSSLLLVELTSDTGTVAGLTMRMIGSTAGIQEGVFQLDGRVELWNTLTTSKQLNWWVGHGLDGDRYVLRESGSWADHAHNVLLEILLSSGVIGLSFFVAAIGLTSYRWYGNTRSVDGAKWLTALLAFWIIDSLLDPMLVSAGGVLVFGILITKPTVSSPAAPYVAVGDQPLSMDRRNVE